MNTTVQEYLISKQIGCLAVAIKDGAHGAAVHYTLSSQGTFYIQTELKTRKCELLREKGEAPATFVVGFSEEEWKTYQADGTVRLVTTPEERATFAEVRGKQYPGPNFADDQEVAFLEFTPTWSRFTDSNTKPKTIIEE
jgi:uncharacterized protein YhbP (UPF0306 family)